MACRKSSSGSSSRIHEGAAFGLAASGHPQRIRPVGHAARVFGPGDPPPSPDSEAIYFRARQFLISISISTTIQMNAHKVLALCEALKGASEGVQPSMPSSFRLQEKMKPPASFHLTRVGRVGVSGCRRSRRFRHESGRGKE